MSETKEKRKLRINAGMIVLVPNKSRSYGQIIRPSAYFNTSVCQVYEVGPKCHSMLKPNDIVLVSAKFTERAYQILDKNSGMFICMASNVFGVIKRNRVYPTRKMIVIERLIDEQRFNGTIVIPAAQKSTDQSLEGIVYGFGIQDGGLDKGFKVKGIKPGQRIRLRGWQEHMIEVGWQDKYFLFVKEEDIICEI